MTSEIKAGSETQRPAPRLPPASSIGLLLGPAAFAVLRFGPGIPEMSQEAQAVAAVATWMAIWWLTEAIPLPATALLPIILLPPMTSLPIGEVTARYGSSVIFLFLGGFILSAAVQKWGLHWRLALQILGRTGGTPHRTILGFMLATGFLSMWISNSATAIMMMPIAIAAVSQLSTSSSGSGDGSYALAPALMLGIAYAASVGGLATIIGSPPNAIFVGYADQAFGETITFLRWMQYGLPIAVLGGAITYLYLTRVAFRGALMNTGRFELAAGSASIPPLSAPQLRVLAVFGLTAGAWLGNGLLDSPLGIGAIGGVSDTNIAITGALMLFILPARGRSGPRLLEWGDLSELPWGILVLFGGGLALAAGIDSSGLAAWTAGHFDELSGAPTILTLLAIALIVIFLTEITSNTATASVFIPIVAGVAVSLGEHPYVLMIVTTTAASCAFMLPVATPPNAVVFATGEVTMRQMARVGLGLNLILAPLLALAAQAWLSLAWNL